VAIKSFPDLQNGTAMASNWTIGQTQTFTLSCPIPSYARKKTEIAFVGFIQDDGNRKVAQAFRLEKEPLTYDAEAVSVVTELTCSDMLSPVVTVKNNGVSALTDLTITPYVDGNALTPVSWSGNVATGGTVQVPMNIQHGATLNGSHTFSAVVTGMNGSDFDNKNNSAKADFMLVSNYQDMPVLEDFDDAGFPKQNWVIVNSNGGPGWVKYNNSGAYNRLGSKSIRYEFYKNTVAGDKDELI
jgi:hypothetical protein